MTLICPTIVTVSQESRVLAKLLKLVAAHTYPAHIEKFRPNPGLWGYSGQKWDTSVSVFHGNSRIDCISTARDVLVESSGSFFALGSAQLELERVQRKRVQQVRARIQKYM